MPSLQFPHSPAAWKPATGRVVSGLLGLLYGATLLPAAAAAFPPQQIEFFESKIRPVLATQCYDCHSAQAKKLKADESLRVTLLAYASGTNDQAVTARRVSLSVFADTATQRVDSLDANQVCSTPHGEPS